MESVSAAKRRGCPVSRVPDHPPKPIRTLKEYLDGGFAIRSFCSTGGHSHDVNLQLLIAERGPDIEIDYAFKCSLTCPVCGAAGGGLQISQPGG